MAQQYDVSKEQQKILEEKANRRAFLRNEFLKARTDPFQHASGEAGIVFDPALQRYQAMKSNLWDYFKTSPKNVANGLLLIVLPLSAYTYISYKYKMKLEGQYRRGEVAYKDRNFKFT
ncbi:uncharacterized protein LOC132700349 [Cylas formicarius]|uniref:uncharacterized protein LOC132700349 n=1 Tax=Cylas formicarius TaxID=197179 RepID=UPI002958484F|nr:uncharacterized protein LOC132700349 [Cylas formicarius]